MSTLQTKGNGDNSKKESETNDVLPSPEEMKKFESKLILWFVSIFLSLLLVSIGLIIQGITDNIVVDKLATILTFLSSIGYCIVFLIALFYITHDIETAAERFPITFFMGAAFGLIVGDLIVLYKIIVLEPW